MQYPPHPDKAPLDALATQIHQLPELARPSAFVLVHRINQSLRPEQRHEFLTDLANRIEWLPDGEFPDGEDLPAYTYEGDGMWIFDESSDESE